MTFTATLTRQNTQKIVHKQYTCVLVECVIDLRDYRVAHALRCICIYVSFFVLLSNLFGYTGAVVESGADLVIPKKVYD